jgi:hypothetical protein
MGAVSGCDGPAKHSLILPQNSPVLFSSFYLLHDCVIADDAALGNNRTQYMVRTIIGLLRLQEMLKLCLQFIGKLSRVAGAGSGSLTVAQGVTRGVPRKRSVRLAQGSPQAQV